MPIRSRSISNPTGSSSARSVVAIWGRCLPMSWSRHFPVGSPRSPVPTTVAPGAAGGQPLAPRLARSATRRDDARRRGDAETAPQALREGAAAAPDRARRDDRVGASARAPASSLVFEGRDAAGKGGVIKRITQYVSPRVARVVALPAPTEREQTEWYFQRYVAHLPAAGEIVIFDRSWYNRAGVEHVMGFCSARGVPALPAPVPDLRAHARRRRDHPRQVLVLGLR